MNFSHPLTDAQLIQIETLVGQPVGDVISAPVRFNTERPFTAQIIELLDSLPITPDCWQTGHWLVVLSSMNYITALLLADLHGRMGHFATIVRLRPVAHALITEYEVAEIINLQTTREGARTRR